MNGFGLIGSIVDWGELGSTVAAAFIAGVGITAAFAVAILGGAQFLERRREGELATATGAAILGIAGLAVCAAGIVFGLIVMLSD
jgi:hypothetical protein